REYNSQWGQDEDGSPVPSQQIFQGLEFQGWSQELRLNGELGDGLFDYTLGGFYYDADGVMEARVTLNYSQLDFIHGPDTTPSTSKAVFFNGTLHPTPDLSLTGGLRYSHDRKEYTYNRFNPDGSIPQPCTGFPFGADQPPNCTLAGMQDRENVFVSERWDWRLVADYRFSDAL